MKLAEIFDIKEVDPSSQEEKDLLNKEMDRVIKLFNSSQDFFKCDVEEKASNRAGPNNMRGKLTMAFKLSAAWDPKKDYKTDGKYTYDVIMADPKKLDHLFGRQAENLAYKKVKDFYSFIEENIKGFKVSPSYQRASFDKRENKISVYAKILFEKIY